MNKHLTYRNATILNIMGWVFTIAAWLLPRPWDSIAAVLGITAFGAAIYIRALRQGYAKGYTDAHARAVIIEEVNHRLRAEEEPLADAYDRFTLPANAKPDTELWEALRQSYDATASEGTEWGTDYWGDILSEPSEEQARQLAKAAGSNVYSRQPHCEWVQDPKPENSQTNTNSEGATS